MKRTQLKEIKDLALKELILKINTAKLEIADLSLDKNTNKLKDIKSVSKKRKDIAQMLTIVRQKQLINQLESAGQLETAEVAETLKTDKPKKRIKKETK